MQASWPLRFISDSVSDMSNVRSMLSRQASDAVDTTADGHESDSGPDDFFENASPDTKSEVSQYYDAESEAPGSSRASQADPTEEGAQGNQHSVANLPGNLGRHFDWETRYAMENEQRIADQEVAREMTHQRQQMSAQLFGLTQENKSLQEQVQGLEERLAQEQADKQAQVFVAAFVSRMMERIIAEQRVAVEHQRQIRDLQQRYSSLHAMMDSQREQRRVEETEERERQNSWGYHLRQSSRLAGCVALGAGSMLVLIHVFEGKQGSRPFMRRP